MSIPRSRLLLFLAVGAAAGGLAAGLLAWRRLERSVRGAVEAADPLRRPLQLVPLATGAAAGSAARWGGADIDAVVAGPSGLVMAGGAGVFDEQGDLGNGLPTLKAVALAHWRQRLVVGLSQGGVFVRNRERWHELRSGWGPLHARALAESEAGELVIGAREGLFRAAWGDPSLERLDARSVRAIAVGRGRILAGGETGLVRVSGRTAREIEAPDPWIEAVGESGDAAWAVTAAGLARSLADAPFEPVRGGEEVVTGVAHAGSFYALTATGDALLRFDASGAMAEEALPASARRLFVADGEIVAHTGGGLLVRGSLGWRPVLRDAPPTLPPGPAHVTALARLGDTVVAGLFDGGLLLGTPLGEGFRWRSVPGSAAWGVNALLPAGGVVWVASLRGAARLDGDRLTPVTGPGAAYSLAATRDGVAIGYGQGVRLPDGPLLSAFHGLPGNQATALLACPELVVGTPSGLGGIDTRRVAWSATSAEGRLPHPWVTALAATSRGVLVGTYGGGVARRRRDGRFEALAGTDGLKVSSGAMVPDRESVWLGSEGRGLFRLAADADRFERLDVALPSPQVTAVLPLADGLLVGTDEGLVKLSGAAVGR